MKIIATISFKKAFIVIYSDPIFFITKAMLIAIGLATLIIIIIKLSITQLITIIGQDTIVYFINLVNLF